MPGGDSGANHSAALASRRPSSSARCWVFIILGHDDPHLGPARLDRLPQLVAHDLEIGSRHDLPLVARVRPGDRFARARVLDERAAVPLETTDIDWVVEDAAIDLPPDRGVAPVAPARSPHALSVEPLRDRARTDAGGELLEDATDHRSLGGVDAA